VDIKRCIHEGSVSQSSASVSKTAPALELCFRFAGPGTESTVASVCIISAIKAAALQSTTSDALLELMLLFLM
jgi:hypothetical protein